MIKRTYRDFSGKLASEIDLTDAISRHGYAFYSDVSGKMSTCDLSPPGKAKVICALHREFDTFTAHYMSDDTTDNQDPAGTADVRDDDRRSVGAVDDQIVLQWRRPEYWPRDYSLIE